MRTRRGFTLIELLIVIGVLAVLVTILVPVVANVLEDARVGKCMANLKHLSGAIDAKLAENNGNRIFGMAHASDTAATFAEVNTDPLSPALGSNDLATLSKNAMQNVWKMVADYEVTPRAFICPSDGTTDRAQVPGALKYGWTALTEFSYGIQYPYGDYSINDTRLKDRTVIMADRNPGGAVGGGITHSNHDDGVAVLFYDGNVKFHEADDSLAGYAGDEIYANTTPVVGGAPNSAGDTSITPSTSR